MSEAVATLGLASRDYERHTADFEATAIRAAEAEATYKREEAKFKVRVIAEGVKVSVALAEVMAAADDTISDLYREYKLSAAVLDAATKRLQQLRERVATGRTYVASERAADQFHADHT